MTKEELKRLLKIDQKKEEVGQIVEAMEAPDFWSKQTQSIQAGQRLSYLNNLISRFESAQTESEISELEKESLFDGPYDKFPALLSIHAGAGGTEAQDWANMLLRMYLRFAEKKNFKAQIINKSDGEEAGIKSATLRIDGPNVYGLLKSELGTHRLVRISPFDADKARHTSFALVEVLPEFQELEDIEIDSKDLRVDVYRSSGHGGQSVNTTDSAVRITHLPTKITVAIQNERSQIQNRETALKILKIKLKMLEIEKQKNKERELKGDFLPAEWGSQIRSYILQPYQQVKDHRTNFETNNPNEVLDGEIDKFQEAYLRFIHK